MYNNCQLTLQKFVSTFIKLPNFYLTFVDIYVLGNILCILCSNSYLLLKWFGKLKRDQYIKDQKHERWKGEVRFVCVRVHVCLCVCVQTLKEEINGTLDQ